MRSKCVLIVATSLFSIGIFAQKNELKAAEKALKADNPAEAKNILMQSESLFSNLEAADKAKFYVLKSKVLFELIDRKVDVAGNLDNVIEAVQTLQSIDESQSKPKYQTLVSEDLTKIGELLVNEAVRLGQEQKYSKATERLFLSYQLDKTKQDNLYYAASYAVNGKDYDKALEYYEMLKEINYSGEKTIYSATNVINGNVENFPNKIERDKSIKLTLHKDPVDEKVPSKKGEIYSNYALILIQKGEIEKAKTAVSDARKMNPDDISLIITEANMYSDLKDYDTYQKLINEAIQKDPTNHELFFNLGVVSMKTKNVEKAIEYYNKTIELDPKYSDAYLNLAIAKLDADKVIIEKMNSLGTSSADNKKYEQLKLEREVVLKDAYPYIEKAIETGNNEIEVKRTLLNIYYTLDMNEKYKKLKAEIDSM